MKIYTRGGDSGQTSLYSGQRVSKHSDVIEAIGAVDECNSSIGAAIAQLPQDEAFADLREQLIVIQHALFDLGAALATPRTEASERKIARTSFGDQGSKQLEAWIDGMDEDLPPLTTFILPGGHPAGALLHVSRGLCRRAERAVVPCFEKTDISEDVIVYLNRLSDYLFMAARTANHRAGVPETSWQKHLV